MRGGTGDDDGAEALTATLAELRRLAAAHEGYAALLPDRDNRAAAAFVAASAHQVVTLGLGRGGAVSRIDTAAVSSDVCATLLFLIAEAHADAAEAAKRIRPHPDHAGAIESALLIAIRNLAQGRLFDIVHPALPDLDVDSQDIAASALQALQHMLLKGVRRLASQLRSRVDRIPEAGAVEPASAIFARVKALCVEPIEGVLGSGEQVYSLYPGPLHLANLLLAVEGDLIACALTRIPTPGGAEEGGWWQVLRRMARGRPYLWRNHREAIASGYLEQGISSAISFPTGAGKSTLAELKIATALLRGEKVVFLAPTHALVGQTTRALQNTFRNYEVIGDVDEDVSLADIYVLPEVTVTTPERCLMLMALQPDVFADLGLIVFDECHLVHPREEDRSRRGLDAMLAILNLSQVAPEADLLLLSAMMKNTAEIAGWLKYLTERECLTLDLAWKPTRQVRGCVVYPAEQIGSLNEMLAKARRDYPNHNNPPAQIQRELGASPFGLFSLLQTWSTTNREDYALVKLIAESQLLTTGRRRGGDWYLTPNGNQTSGAIAAAAVAAGMKTLVFVQTTVFCESCVNAFPARIEPNEVALTEEEQRWRELTVEEIGGAEYCYLKVDDDGLVRTGAASHHSLLLREERELHESLFRRPNGVRALFATSTLAQGMNLPSEVVIISGDSRFDPDAGKMKKLEAHELLNAAGRAGRAGEGAQGCVLLVPSKVIDFDNLSNKINGHWMELQAIFEQADQCLIIDDPLQTVLDQIHDGITKSGTASYLLSKLPLAMAGAEEDPAATLLKRTFAAYRAGLRGDQAWIQSRVNAALAARATPELPEKEKWIEQVAGSTGLAVALLQRLVELLDAGAFDGGAIEIVAALSAWLDTKPIMLMDLVRPDSLEELFGDRYKKLRNDTERAQHALRVIAKLWPLWMSGVPLCRLEEEFLARPDVSGIAKMPGVSSRALYPISPLSRPCPRGCLPPGVRPPAKTPRSQPSWQRLAELSAKGATAQRRLRRG
jgi:superfamily II DNA/RNA helicase